MVEVVLILVGMMFNTNNTMSKGAMVFGCGKKA